ncbi:MAG: ComEC/Rec2 family competence protein [Candidatus Omnitrophica bacterium]|jgi:competence protein ComEC|nr:ComEC/Rec2 family competence protein [Candidatus Omnitrophota bacterium]
MFQYDFSKTISFFIFISFVIGISIGYYHKNIFIYLGLSLLLIILILIKSSPIFIANILILILFVSLGALWQNSVTFHAPEIKQLLNQENDIILTVASLPKDKALKNTFTAQIDSLNSYPLRKKIKAKVIDYTKTLEYLNRYHLKTKLVERKYRKRTFYYLWVKKQASITKLPLGFWHNLRRKISFYLLKTYQENCNSAGYAFLSAIFLGRRELLEAENHIFALLGVSHLLAISGLHLGLFSIILFWALRFFGINFRVRLIISLIVLYIYTFITGASSSTARAVIMYSVFSINFLLQRKTEPLNSLAVAGLIILMIEPQTLLDIGFQLSFVSVFSIILGFKIWEIKTSQNMFFNYLIQLFYCSFFVTLFLTPLVSYYFGKIYLLSIFYNIILIPFFTFILAINFILIIFSPFNFISQSLGVNLSLLVWLFNKLVYFLSSLRFSYLSYYFSLRNVLVYYFCLCIIVVPIVFKNKRFFIFKS